MNDLHLSDDQAQALDAVTAALSVRNGVPSVLVGPAGTGKTTILGILADRMSDRQIRYAAPTGRAAKVLSEKLRARGVTSGASTIHRALYRGAKETDKGLDFGDPQAPVEPGGVLIIDEASMVGREIDADIRRKLPARASLLYVGDREQLPPVVREPRPGESPWGADFENPTAALTEVHRQALESPIARIATAIRTGGKVPEESEPGFERAHVQNDHPAAWLAEACRQGRDAVLLCYTNGARSFTNKLVRANLGLSGGEPVVVGDRLVVTFNCYDADLMNGEVVDIAEVRPAALSARTQRRSPPTMATPRTSARPGSSMATGTMSMATKSIYTGTSADLATCSGPPAPPTRTPERWSRAVRRSRAPWRPWRRSTPSAGCPMRDQGTARLVDHAPDWWRRSSVEVGRVSDHGIQDEDGAWLGTRERWADVCEAHGYLIERGGVSNG